MTQSQDVVIYNVENHIATITLNDPKSLNAFSTLMKSAIISALQEAEADADVRVIILQGAGGNFSSGGDIKEMLSDGLEREALSEKLKSMVEGAGDAGVSHRANLGKRPRA